MSKTVCFTGHRHISDDQYSPLYEQLLHTAQKQIEQGATCFRTGGAVGFDTMAALAVLTLRKSFPHIRLELVLPCPSQTRGWSESDTVLYEQIKAQADNVRYVSTGYYTGVLQQRNRALVEGSDVCIAYLKSSHGGGTAFTASLAIRQGLEFINLFDLFPH